ncbi:MAG: hypothetical protein JSR39_00800 [Verrucomicrobia bacterium]|nr:hypothetical protein [Verrucomicrobiota bacterium]
MSIQSDRPLNAAGNFALGVGADIFSVLATQPLDTAATYVMSQKGMPSFGPWLWRGAAANCSGAFVQGGVPFMVNGLIAEHFFKTQHMSQGQLVANGIFTGLISAGAIAPFERVAKLHQLYGGSIYSVCERSIAENGMRSFFKAAGPIALRDSVVFGTFFGGRRVVENQLESYVPHVGLRESIASITTGVFAGAISAPAARVNVLMQGDTVGAYPTMAQTFRSVVQQEGVQSLFKGAGARAGFMGGYYVTLAIGYNMLRNNLPGIFYKTTVSSQ